MKNLLTLISLIVLCSCAPQTPQEAANMRFGMQMLANSAAQSNAPMAPMPAAPTQTRCYQIGNQVNCRTF